MGGTETNRTHAELDRARGEMYGFFAALLLTPPSPEGVGNLLTGAGGAGLESLFPGHSSLAEFRRTASDYRKGSLSDEDFLLDYESLFRVPGESFVCPYESVYRGCETSSKGPHPRMVWGTSARRVVVLYQEEGLALGEDFTELPDHLGVELEFMACLCRWSAEGFEAEDLEKTGKYRYKQKVFLADHLISWGLDCVDKIAEKANTGLYRCSAILLGCFLDADRKFLETGF